MALLGREKLPVEVQVTVCPPEPAATFANAAGVAPVWKFNVQADGAVPDTTQYTDLKVCAEFSNKAVLTAFVTGGKIAVPGVAGPPAPAANCDCSVSTAGEVSAHEGVEDDDNAHTVLLIVTTVSAPDAPAVTPQYGLQPTTLPPVPIANGAAIVTVDVDPSVVIVEVAAVSVDKGVSVLVAV